MKAPLLTLACLLTAAVAPAHAQDVARGKALAERWCSNCHVVDRAPATARSDGLPTFPALANRAGMTEATLKGAMTALHSRMPDFELGARDQNDLAAYILSLKSK